MRIRSLKPGFFKNEHLCELSAWHRICYEGLWCCADREGRIEDRPRRLKAEIFPYDDLDMNSLLWDLMHAGFIVRYCAPNLQPLLWIPSWASHQFPRSDEAESKYAAFTPGSEREDGTHVSTFPSVRPIETGLPIVRVSQRNSGVYFIQSGKHVKVGCSGNCDARIKKVLRGAPRTKLIGVWWHETSEEAEESEAGLHQRFAESRINHEWFRETPELKDFIRTVTGPSLVRDADVTTKQIGSWVLGLGSGVLLDGTSAADAASPEAIRPMRAQDLVDLWNATTKPPIPRCRELTDERRRRIRSRTLKRPDLSEWREAFEYLQGDAFYRGDGGRGWIVDIDWMLKNDTNVTRVLERCRGRLDARTVYDWTCPHSPEHAGRQECATATLLEGDRSA